MKSYEYSASKRFKTRFFKTCASKDSKKFFANSTKKSNRFTLKNVSAKDKMDIYMALATYFNVVIF